MPPRCWSASASAFAAWLLLLVCPVARADSLPSRESALDDQLADGDIDEEDRTNLHFASIATPMRAHGETWLSVVGFANALTSGRTDVGGMIVVGLALDRLASGSVRRLADPLRPQPAPPAPAPSAAPPPQRPSLVAPSLARACVAAALRVSGLGTNDEPIDAVLARARASAWLPETRMRAMRLIADAERATTLATTDGTNYYQTVGAHLVLELRLTWRFDRLLYAGDEPTLERTRLERQEARSRLAGRTLEVLFAWQRAVVATESALVGSDDELQARLRASEAKATLDVLTDGWFSHRADRAE